MSTMALICLPLANSAASTSCHRIEKSTMQKIFSDNIAEGALTLQDKTTWTDNGGATASEMQVAIQLAEDRVARDERRAIAGDVAFLLVRKPPGSKGTAVDIGDGNDISLSCLATRGDNVLLRDGPSVHWTTIYAMDDPNEKVIIVDPWPESFPFLATNSAGDWSGELIVSKNSKLIELPLVEFDKLLQAVIRVDDAKFSLELLDYPCNCVQSDSEIQALYNTLMVRHLPHEIDISMQIIDHVRPPAKAGSFESFDAGSIYLAGILGVNISKSKADHLIDILNRRYYGAFDDISPKALLDIYETVQNTDDTFGKIVKAAINSASIAGRFSELESVNVEIQNGRIYENKGDLGAAVDEIKLAAVRAEDIYKTNLDSAKSFRNVYSWRAGVSQKTALDSFKVLIYSHSLLVHLYGKLNNIKMSAYHFSKLTSYDEPYPPSILIESAIDLCRAIGSDENIASLSSIDLHRQLNEIRTDVRKMACVPPDPSK